MNPFTAPEHKQMLSFINKNIPNSYQMLAFFSVTLCHYKFLAFSKQNKFRDIMIKYQTDICCTLVDVEISL